MRNLRRWAIRLIIALSLIVGASWLIENYRGGQKWQQAQERAAKLGVSLDLSDYAAPSISDSQNLLKNPDFSREWNGEIEPRLERWAAMELDIPKSLQVPHQRGEIMDYLQFFPDETDSKVAIERLTEATRDIESRLNKLAEIVLSYPPKDLTPRPQSMLESAKAAAGVTLHQYLIASLNDQALLALHRNEQELAIRNCEVIERLAQNFSSPDLLHLFVTKSFHATIHTIVREGILLQAWDSGHLERLSQLTTTKVNRWKLVKALSFEAALIPPSIEGAETIQDKINEASNTAPKDPPSMKENIQHWIHYDGPKGWQERRKAFALNAILDQIEAGNQWKWQKAEALVLDLEAPTEEEDFSFDPLAPVRDFDRPYSGAITSMFEHTATERLCNFAIEIEKFRLTTGSYPATPSELPQGLPVTDPTDPQKRPLHYELLPRGGFQIYSLFLEEQYPESKDRQLRWQFPGKA